MELYDVQSKLFCQPDNLLRRRVDKYSDPATAQIVPNRSGFIGFAASRTGRQDNAQIISARLTGQPRILGSTETADLGRYTHPRARFP